MTHSTLQPRSPFAGLLDQALSGDGITIADRSGLGIAIIRINNERATLLAQRVREHFGIELPRGPRRASAGAISLAAIGPNAWLATQEDAGNTLAELLRATLGDDAS